MKFKEKIKAKKSKGEAVSSSQLNLANNLDVDINKNISARLNQTRENFHLKNVEKIHYDQEDSADELL